MTLRPCGYCGSKRLHVKTFSPPFWAVLVICPACMKTDIVQKMPEAQC